MGHQGIYGYIFINNILMTEIKTVEGHASGLTSMTLTFLTRML